MNFSLDDLNFEKMGGLVPTIVQDAQTKNVLMLGFQNKEAVQKTQETGEVHFFSRTRKTLWKKGETSGNILRVQEMQIDCDRDTILILAYPTGVVCHTGAATCFSDTNTSSFLPELFSLLQQRKKDLPKGSYTAELFQQGLDRVAQKVGEEAVEVVIASKNNDREDFCNESADLLFHYFLLLVEKGVSLQEIEEVLRKRHER